jgi:NAD(P)H-quinone oxidoreductase subunit H
MLRASGIQWDLRKVDLYESCNQSDWKVQWQKERDSLARYLVRISEMRESIRIIQQAIGKKIGGPYENYHQNLSFFTHATRHIDLV